MTIPWYLAALGAAMMWGVHYPLVDQALKKISLLSVLFFTSLPFVLVPMLFPRVLAADYARFWSLPGADRAVILALPFTAMLGAVFLYLAIGSKNATLAALIEISYPVFVVLFAWLLFREMHLTPSVVAGAALVFTGVAVIVLNNP